MFEADWGVSYREIFQFCNKYPQFYLVMNDVLISTSLEIFLKAKEMHFVSSEGNIKYYDIFLVIQGGHGNALGFTEVLFDRNVLLERCLDRTNSNN